MKKKIWIVLGVVAVLLVVGYFALPMLRNGSSAGQSSFQTEAAKTGNLTAFVGATGTVRANQSAVLVWQTSGQVDTVKVKKGQMVKDNDELANLQQTSLAQNIILAQADLINAQTALDKTLNVGQARADAQLAMVQAEKALNDAQKASQSKLYQRASQNTIDIAHANLITANEALDRAESAFNANSGRGDSDPVYAAALSQVAQARQNQVKADYNFRYSQGLPDPLDVEEVNAKLDQAKAKLLSAKQDWEKIKDGPNPNDVAAAQARLASAQATLNLQRMVAPFAGTITSVNVLPGDLISAGKAAFQIDDLSRLLVDVQVSEVDINRVQIGQPVSLTFDAISDQTFSGTIDEISSVGAVTNGAVNFTVTIQLNNPSADVRPGMTSAVNIAVDQLNNVLMIPSRAVRTEDGKRVVYVLKDGTANPVEITLGSSSGNYSQVSKGDVKAGDLIILNPPATFGRPSGGGPFGN